MSTAGFKNNPLYTDITKLDHLSPQPVFAYGWNIDSGRWEPSSELGGGAVDIGNINDLISGLSGVLASPAESVPQKLLTKTVNQKIEEDFILMENIPDEDRYGSISGNVYGQDRFIMDDLFNVHYENARTNPSTPETGHPNYFILAEETDPNRGVQQDGVFHTDTAHGLRFDNPRASLINSYELRDFSELYTSGLAESIVLFNEASYPLQFHTIDETFDYSDPLNPENTNIIFLDTDTSVSIQNNEAEKVYVKRQHTISGYTVKYNLIYRDES